MRTARRPITAPLFGSQPRSPVLRLLWLGTPLPNLPVRAPAADAFTEVLLTDFTAGYCSRRPLITAGHPVRSSVPSPSCKNPGSGTPPPHRPAHCNYVLLPGSSCLPGPAVSLGYERNHSQIHHRMSTPARTDFFELHGEINDRAQRWGICAGRIGRLRGRWQAPSPTTQIL